MLPAAESVAQNITPFDNNCNNCSFPDLYCSTFYMYMHTSVCRSATDKARQPPFLAMTYVPGAALVAILTAIYKLNYS